MYERFFGFRELPFRLTPDPNYLFLSRKHGEAFAHLLYAVREGSGFVAITGEIGAGKTTLIRTLLKELRDTKENVAAAYIFNPVYSPVELLQSINAEFGLPSRTGNKKELTEHLNAFVLAQKSDNGRTVVIVDEAQNLDAVILEELRLLSNLETETEKLLHIVLIGQPELRDLLGRPELLQLSQRITVRWHLNSLDRIETAEYVSHRLRVAGGPNVGGIFDSRAVALLYDHSGGVPRLINILAHRALLVAYTKGLHAVGGPEVSVAAAELEEGRYPISHVRRGWLYRVAVGVAVAVSAAVVAFLLLFPLRGDYEEPAPADASSLLVKPVSEKPTRLGRGTDEKDSAGVPAVATVSTAAASVAKHEKITERLGRRLARVSVFDGATKSVTELFRLWGRKSLTSEETAAGSLELESIARKRGLNYLSGEMSPALIEAIDLPAILEFNLPRENTPYYVLLTKLTAETMTIQLGSPVDFPRPVLDAMWNGRAHILWSDHERFRRTMGPGSGGPSVLRLQALLREAGVYDGIVNGIYGDESTKAVRRFQKQHSLLVDGITGPLTQIMLYNVLDRFKRPVLAGEGAVVAESGRS